MKCVASEISHKQSEVANIRLQRFNTQERFRQVDQRTLHKLSTHVQTYYTGPFGHLKRLLTTRGFRCQIVQHITVEHLQRRLVYSLTTKSWSDDKRSMDGRSVVGRWWWHSCNKVLRFCLSMAIVIPFTSLTCLYYEASISTANESAHGRATH